MTSLLLLKQLRLAQNPVAYKIKSSVCLVGAKVGAGNNNNKAGFGGTICLV